MFIKKHRAKFLETTNPGGGEVGDGQKQTNYIWPIQASRN